MLSASQRLFLIVSSVSAAVLVSGASALQAQDKQTLTKFLARAYETSPALGAARAGQRATDEILPQAQSQLFRPQITINAQEGRTVIKQEEKDSNALGAVDTKKRTSSRDSQYGYTLALPLFRGGQTIAGINEAKSAIAAGQASLISTEIAVLAAAVTTYADVVYYRTASQLGSKTVANYQQRVERTLDGLKAKRRTVSDLSLFRNSLASSQKTLASSEGERRAAEASFKAISGLPPGELQHWPSLNELPITLEKALNVARTNNPTIRSAEHTIDEYENAVRVAEGVLFPQVSLVQGFTREHDSLNYRGGTAPFDQINREDTWSATLSMTMPLYAGGENHSAVRAKKQKLSESRLTLANVHLTVEQSVTAAWEHLVAQREGLSFAQQSVRALDDALEALEFQHARGDATSSNLIDIIDSRDTARISVEATQRAILIAGSILLKATGQLTASALALPVELYDPEVHLRKVDGKLFGLGD
jgi:outer membrane protein